MKIKRVLKTVLPIAVIVGLYCLVTKKTEAAPSPTSKLPTPSPIPDVVVPSESASGASPIMSKLWWGVLLDEFTRTGYNTYWLVLPYSDNSTQILMAGTPEAIKRQLPIMDVRAKPYAFTAPVYLVKLDASAGDEEGRGAYWQLIPLRIFANSITEVPELIS